jgi:hypothetical protein
MNLWFILDNYDALVVGLDVGLVMDLWFILDNYDALVMYIVFVIYVRCDVYMMFAWMEWKKQKKTVFSRFA